MIYLDNQATTPVDPRVVAAMRPFWEEEFGNPHSLEHGAGRRAADAVEAARAEVAALIGAQPAEIVFTSGATEANNLAIKGAARFAGAAPRRRVITAATEHKCVLESVRDLGQEGFEAVVLPPRADGVLEPARLTEALAVPTLLVSVMLAHNETGVVQDVPALAALVRQAGAKMHSDLAQAAGKIPIDVGAMGLDLASVSAHKLYGPKGIGALYVRRRPRMRLAPLFSGGGQERGLRPGTLPTPLIVGFGEACRLAREALTREPARLHALRERLLAGLNAAIPGLAVNGALDRRLPGNLSLRFPGTTALALIEACPALALSTGSACTSGDIAPSHVLTALGLTPAEAAATLRIGIGRFTTADDIDAAIRLLADAWARCASETPIRAEA